MSICYGSEFKRPVPSVNHIGEDSVSATMKVCYVDEAGCTGALPSATSPIQPVLILTGMFIDYSDLHRLTASLSTAKQRFYPGLTVPDPWSYLSWILAEVKGSEVRKAACAESRNQRRHARLFLTEVMDIAEAARAKLAGRIWVKGIGQPMNGTSVYTYSIQAIYNDFQEYLTQCNDYGVVIVDSRVKHLNTPVAHSIFTQKFKNTGDSYDRIVELPAFSHSDNHAGLQVTDLLCSGILTPMAVDTYVTGHVTSVHVRPRYADIKATFGDRIRKLQHRYHNAAGQNRGGFIVSDGIGHKPGGELFR